jgi:hypothetical protein
MEDRIDGKNKIMKCGIREFSFCKYKVFCDSRGRCHGMSGRDKYSQKRYFKVDGFWNISFLRKK